MSLIILECLRLISWKLKAITISQCNFETLVETPRYTGAVYRASGWTRVGTTQGRGRYGTQDRHDKLKKGHLTPAPTKELEALLNR